MIKTVNIKMLVLSLVLSFCQKGIAAELPQQGMVKKVICCDMTGDSYLSVSNINFSPDSRLIVALCNLWTLQHSIRVPKIWNAETGELLHVINRFDEYVSKVVFSPDGRLVAVAGHSKLDNYNRLSIYRTTDWQLLQVLYRKEYSSIHDITFSPDGSMIAALVYLDKTERCKPYQAHVWNCSNGRLLDAFEIGTVTSCSGKIAFSLDGKFIMALCSGSILGVVNIESKSVKIIENLTNPGQTCINCFSFSPDGQTIAVSFYSGIIKLLRLLDCEYVQVLNSGTDGCIEAKFSLDGRYLIMQYYKEKVSKVWSMIDRKFLYMFAGFSVDMSPDSKLLAVAPNTQNTPATIWNMENGARVQELVGPENSRVIYTRFSPDGKKIAMATENDMRICFLE